MITIEKYILLYFLVKHEADSEWPACTNWLYKNSLTKSKSEKCKMLQATSLCRSIAKYAQYVSLTFVEVEKIKCEHFSFVRYLSCCCFCGCFCSSSSCSFSSLTLITRKLHCVRAYYTYQMIAMLQGFFHSGLGGVYELQLAGYVLKTLSKDTSHSWLELMWLLFKYSRLSMYCQAMLELLKEHTLQAATSLLATNWS